MRGIWRHEVEGEHAGDALHVARVSRDEIGACLVTGMGDENIEDEAARPRARAHAEP